eukprot:7428830-Pyramimonas_sp.AAC.1
MPSTSPSPHACPCPVLPGLLLLLFRTAPFLRSSPRRGMEGTQLVFRVALTRIPSCRQPPWAARLSATSSCKGLVGGLKFAATWHGAGAYSELPRFYGM